MGPKHRREREKEALRQEILDAARELFVEEGYENVSMRRIAEKIEYSPTTIYLYFEDKMSLLIGICEETFAKLTEEMSVIRQEAGDPLEALRKGCKAYVHFGLKHPNHYKLTFLNHPQHPKDPDMKMEDSMGMRAFGQLRSAVENCINSGFFRDTDVDAASQMFWAAGHGVTSLLITMHHFPFVDREELIDLTIDSLIEGLRV